MLSDVMGRRGQRVFWTSTLHFFIKKNWIWIYAMTRHAKSNVNILLIRNVPIDPEVRHWSHPLMIPLHCLWAESNNRTRGQFECDVTWFCSCFDFVLSHAPWGWCSIVCWRGWGVHLKLDVQSQRCGKILDADGQRGSGVLKIRQFSWTSYVHRPLTLWCLVVTKDHMYLNELAAFSCRFV